VGTLAGFGVWIRQRFLAGFGVGGSRFLGVGFLCGFVAEAVALAGDLDDLGMLQEAIQDRSRGGHIANEFAPVLQGSVRGHHRAFDFVATEDDLEQAFSASLRYVST
jgi:hypothetical protein